MSVRNWTGLQREHRIHLGREPSSGPRVACVLTLTVRPRTGEYGLQESCVGRPGIETRSETGRVTVAVTARAAVRSRRVHTHTMRRSKHDPDKLRTLGIGVVLKRRKYRRHGQSPASQADLNTLCSIARNGVPPDRIDAAVIVSVGVVSPSCAIRFSVVRCSHPPAPEVILICPGLNGTLVGIRRDRLPLPTAECPPAVEPLAPGTSSPPMESQKYPRKGRLATELARRQLYLSRTTPRLPVAQGWVPGSSHRWRSVPNRQRRGDRVLAKLISDVSGKGARCQKRRSFYIEGILVKFKLVQSISGQHERHEATVADGGAIAHQQINRAVTWHCTGH